MDSIHFLADVFIEDNFDLEKTGMCEELE